MAAGDLDLRAAYRQVIQFFARSLILTDRKGCQYSGEPLCSDEETEFLVSVVAALEAGRGLSPPDVDRLCALFARAAQPRHVDLWYATVQEGLSLLEVPLGTVK